MTAPPPRPTPAELQAAYGRTVPDLVRPGLAVLLCGINPSLWSGAVGLHFANPSNRLWPTLHAAGWTPRRLRPAETGEVLAAGLGITNVNPCTGDFEVSAAAEPARCRRPAAPRQRLRAQQHYK